MHQWIGLLLFGACLLVHGVTLWQVGQRIVAQRRGLRSVSRG